MAKYIVINGIRIDKNYQDFVPETFGRLTTIGPKFRIADGTYQVCQCSCGNVTVKRSQCIGNQTLSCGCIAKEVTRNRSVTHGHGVHGKQTAEYKTWGSMFSRCYNKKMQYYKNYGGRGIEVCKRWWAENNGYLNFLNDMGPRPSNQHSIDRIDVNGDYCPENCRWATRKEQGRNKQRSRYVVAFGQTKTVAEWSELFGVAENTITFRLNSGFAPYLAVSLRGHKDRKWSK